MTFNESMFLDIPTITILCDICDKCMYMSEVKQLQHFPQTQNSIHICSDCSKRFIKKAFEDFMSENATNSQ
ncbi:MAG: hypothetical protein R2685_10875 [Candidatus Nitrosocosmicus sp.]|nr:hypothetical protein [Candidatus Nitrosocosmicus sp.]